MIRDKLRSVARRKKKELEFAHLLTWHNDLRSKAWIRFDMWEVQGMPADWMWRAKVIQQNPRS